eukprot:g832.t1
MDDAYKKTADGFPEIPHLHEVYSKNMFQSERLWTGFFTDPEVMFRINQTTKAVERVRSELENNLTGSGKQDPLSSDARDSLKGTCSTVASLTADDKSPAFHDEVTVENALLDSEGAGNNVAALLHLGDEDSILSSLKPPMKSHKRRTRRISHNHANNDSSVNSLGDRFCMDDLFLFTDRNLHGVEQVKISGAGMYEAHCYNLMLIPMTLVIKSLKKEQCILDHCRIGRDGAEALSRALSINNIITTLSLIDCSLDSKACTPIYSRRKVAASFVGTGSSKHILPSQQIRSRRRLGSTMMGNLLGEDIERLRQVTHASNSTTYSKISSLNLSDNQLGVLGAKCLAVFLDPEITQKQTLTDLTLVNTCLSEEGGVILVQAIAKGNSANGTASIARGLITNSSVQYLDLSWNGLQSEGVLHMGEMLSINLGLKTLNLMSTRTGTEGCLALAEGLKSNNTLESIILDGNPIGDSGARHLMHALSQNKGLKFLGLQGSNMTSTVADGEADSAKFNPTCPDGSYTLLLSNQTDRTVAIQLCQLDKDNKENFMRNVKLDGKEINPKSLDWPNRMPTQGKLSLDFVTFRSRRTMSVIDHKKITALEAQFSNPSMTDSERLSIIHMFAPYHLFLCCQIENILQKFSISDERLEATSVLFTRAVDTDINLKTLLRPLHERERRQFYQDVGFYSCYVFSNPTAGHYELDLTFKPHRMIANRLKDCALSEKSGPVWQNIVYDEYSKQLRLPFNHGPPEAWKTMIPTVGTLSLDYVAASSIPEDALVKVEFTDKNKTIPSSNSSVADTQIMCLRSEITSRFLTCKQVVQILSSFKLGPHRVESVICCYANICDIENFWTVLYLLSPVEQSILLFRLSPVTCFNPNHLSLHWILDISNSIHEDIAKKLTKAALIDIELPNFWNIRLNGERRRRQITENSNLWAVFTTDTFTPFLEFDFIGNDTWTEVFGLTLEEINALTTGDKLELRKHYANKLESRRMRVMSSYFTDNSGYKWSDWQTRTGLMQPLSGKSPWLAIWDKHLRRLVRLTIRLSKPSHSRPHLRMVGGRSLDEVQNSSPMQDLFLSKATADEVLTREAFLEVRVSFLLICGRHVLYEDHEVHWTPESRTGILLYTILTSGSRS